MTPHVPFTHHMYVMYITKNKFCILICIFTFVTTTFGLHTHALAVWLSGNLLASINIVVLRHITPGYCQDFGFHMEQCGACRRKPRLTDTDLCPCGETQTMSHIVESCSLTKLNGSISWLHSADEDAVSWLTNYGS